MCTIICQCKMCRNTSAETNYDYNFAKQNTNNDYSDDDYVNETF